MLFAAVFSVAFADRVSEAPVEVCSDLQFAQVVPASGSFGVPVDVAPALLLSGCGQEGVLDIMVTAEGSNEPVYEGVFEVSGSFDGQMFLELPSLELAPETDYVLRVLGMSFQGGEVRFETGSELAVPVDAPLLERVEAFGFEDGDVWEATAFGRVDHWDPVFVRVRSDDAPTLDTVVWSEAGADFNVYTRFDTDTPCLVAEARDARGDWHASEPVCVTIQEETFDGDSFIGRCGTWGCSSAPGAAWSLLAVPLLLVRRRR